MASILGYKRNGYFIDLAANDAVKLSNTRALERDYGWSRICIEPNPRYHDRHQAVRTCRLSSSLPWPTPSPTSNSGTRARLVA